MHFPEEAKHLLEKMREKYSDQDCYALGYEDDDGTSGLFELEYKLRQALDAYVKDLEAFLQTTT